MDNALSLSSAAATVGMSAPKLSPMVQRLAEGSVRTADVDESKIPAATRAKLHKAAQEFESTFVTQMFSHMFDSIEVDETFGGGRGEEMFRSLLTNEYGKMVTQRGGLGISDSVYRELLRAQEAHNA